MDLILDSIEKVGPDRKKVIADLANVKDRDTIVGMVTFDDHGQNTVPVITKYVIQDGKFIAVNLPRPRSNTHGKFQCTKLSYSCPDIGDDGIIVTLGFRTPLFAAKCAPCVPPTFARVKKEKGRPPGQPFHCRAVVRLNSRDYAVFRRRGPP
jgi:hypothetical protein